PPILRPPPPTPLPYTTLFRSPGIIEATAGGVFLARGEQLPRREERNDGHQRAGVEDAVPGKIIHDNAAEDIGDRGGDVGGDNDQDRKSTRLNSSHVAISYAVF